MAEKHYHAFLGPAEGPVRFFSCRASDVFNTREAAQKWAEAQRPAGRRIIRQCDGGQRCPGREVPSQGERLPAPTPRPRRRRSARLVRLRKRLDELQPRELADLEAWLDGAVAA